MIIIITIAASDAVVIAMVFDAAAVAVVAIVVPGRPGGRLHRCRASNAVFPQSMLSQTKPWDCSSSLGCDMRRLQVAVAESVHGACLKVQEHKCHGAFKH